MLAKHCGVSHRTVLRWIKAGYINAYQLPGRGDHRVLVEDCIKFLQDHTIPVPGELREAAPTLRVLIVEDDEAAANYMAALLRRDGFTVEVAADGFQAGAMLSSFRPNLMILDLNIPNLSGLEVLGYVRRTADLQRVKVLVASAMPQEELDQAISAGADAALRKPFKGPELKEAVYRLLGISASPIARV